MSGPFKKATSVRTRGAVRKCRDRSACIKFLGYDHLRKLDIRGCIRLAAVIIARQLLRRYNGPPSGKWGPQHIVRDSVAKLLACPLQKIRLRSQAPLTLALDLGFPGRPGIKSVLENWIIVPHCGLCS